MTVFSDAEVAACRADGVVVPAYRLPADRLDHTQSLATRLIADNPHMGDEPVASPHVPGSGVQNVRSDGHPQSRRSEPTRQAEPSKYTLPI